MSQTHDHRVESSEQVFTGRVISVRKDVVTMPGETTSQRDVVEHPGAVGVVALDDDGRVLLVTQYRHPVGRWRRGEPGAAEALAALERRARGLSR